MPPKAESDTTPHDRGKSVGLVVHHPNGVEQLLLAAGATIRLGRGSSADIVIDHPSVSSLHARFGFDSTLR